jgi:hypothetical protein
MFDALMKAVEVMGRTAAPKAAPSESARQAVNDHGDTGNQGDYSQSEDAKLQQANTVRPAQSCRNCVKRFKAIGGVSCHRRPVHEIFAGVSVPGLTGC